MGKILVLQHKILLKYSFLCGYMYFWALSTFLIADVLWGCSYHSVFATMLLFNCEFCFCVPPWEEVSISLKALIYLT